MLEPELGAFHVLLQVRGICADAIAFNVTLLLSELYRLVKETALETVLGATAVSVNVRSAISMLLCKCIFKGNLQALKLTIKNALLLE